MTRRPAALLAGLAVLAAGAGLGLALLLLPPRVPGPALEPRSFADLDGWTGDRHSLALAAFLKSCGPRARGGEPGPASGEWRTICAAAALEPGGDDRSARVFFETWFRPFAVTGAGNGSGLFTGYYEPDVSGSRARKEGFEIPLYRRPDDLITVDLGLFRSDLAGRRIAGRARGGNLLPFESREHIEQGSLSGKGLEIAWLADAVDAFFLHIQGSGRIILEDDGVMRVGYSGQNGHPYTAIGRVLVERGELDLEQVSMQTIRAWLAANPGRAREIMVENASYIFFHEVEGDGPIGALGAVLTPGRSLAVDPRHVPLGAPVWLETEAMKASIGAAMPPIRRLMMAQDTGGAIKGTVRGDIFFGSGEAAGQRAGRMKDRGRYFILLPASSAASSAAATPVTPGGAPR